MPSFPMELAKLATEIAAHQGFVQGAGGNISFKNEARMWVKASGTRLSEAQDRNIFVELELAPARLLASSSEDFSSAIILSPDSEGLRPSIETSLHSLLPHRWVAHVHSVGLLGLLIGDFSLAGIGEAVPQNTLTIDVPYAKPGLRLAQAVFEQLGDNPSHTNPALILLRNHGFVVASDDLDELKAMLFGVESAVRPSVLPSQRDFASKPAVSGWTQLLGEGATTATQAATLNAGPYTPDETVFLGAVPFALVPSETELSGVTSSLFAILADGSVWASSDASHDAAEIALSAVDFTSCMPVEHEATTLTSAEIDELINWDAEKWRKAQQR